MADNTKIEWATSSWNPVDGCAPISEACQKCYAANMAKRFWGDRKFSEIQFHEDRLNQPLKWKRPRMIFVCSMGDLFHEGVIFNWIHEIWDIMKRTPEHIFMVLTKRPRKMKEVVELIYRKQRLGWAKGFWSHVWLGVTAENQKRADERIPILLEIPAAIRFVSVEPMLELINAPIRCPECGYGKIDQDINLDHRLCNGPGWVDWVICGAETGPGARYMKPKWAMDLYSQCQQAGVPFFFKKSSKDDQIDLPREYPR